MSNITNDMVLAAQRGCERGIADTAQAFRHIAGVFWTRSTPLQRVISKEDFEQVLAVRWWRELRNFDPEKAGASTWAWVLAMTARKRTIAHYSYSIRREPAWGGGRRELHDDRPVRFRWREDEHVEVRQLAVLSEQETELVHLFARGFDQSGAARVMGCSRDWPRQLKLRLRAKFEDPWGDGHVRKTELQTA